ncbi:hypothetical protein TCE0_044r16469 [Talaromyces pinophilus]|uniref:Uncharacterized protein n=1 Tax=Talaromyces pinophilus TaxID=128442 RepID=A0A478EAU9_TALPI|nr:hypothetical protein TCE0_044r16469 [Talaromyces pinophilus]
MREEVSALLPATLPPFWASRSQKTISPLPGEPTAVLARLHSPPITQLTLLPSIVSQLPLHYTSLLEHLTVHASRVIVVLVEFEFTSSECAALPFIFLTSPCVSSRIPALVISNLNPSFRAPPQNLYHQPSPAYILATGI